MAITDRVIRAVKGEVALYEEVKDDPAATNEAAIVAVVAALSIGVGNSLLSLILGVVFGGGGRLGPFGLLLPLIQGVLGAAVGLAAFAAAAYFASTLLFKMTLTWEQIVRPLGYAFSPLLAGIILVIPCLGNLAMLAVGLYTLYLTYVALRATLNTDTGNTVAVVAISVVATFIASFTVAVFFIPLVIMAS